MSDIKDGGPAFPLNVLECGPEAGQQVVRHQFCGMTLRDYLAAKALPVLIPALANTRYDVSAIAKAAYGLADAMLAERDRK